eukprot:3177361-Karenia_brevis.AAC.1
MTCRRGQLPTTTKGSSRVWVPSLRRWLLPKELAASHGFPVTADLASHAGASERASTTAQNRVRRLTCKASGVASRTLPEPEPEPGI